MNLAAEVKRYIKHKTVLANHSNHYLNTSVLMALRYANELLQLFCQQQYYLTEHDVARYVLQNKMHLQNILPHSENNSYKSSLNNLTKIIEHSQTILKPKAP